MLDDPVRSYHAVGPCNDEPVWQPSIGHAAVVPFGSLRSHIEFQDRKGAKGAASASPSIVDATRASSCEKMMMSMRHLRV